MAIIGGGITGLTAAFRLQQQGISAVLFEATDRVGGVIQTVREGGYLAECGPNTILETSPLIGELITALGLEDHRIDTNESAENRYIVRNKHPVKLPSSPLGFMASPLFSCRAKARLLAEPFIRRAPADEEESLAKFVRRRIGREFLDYAINPFVAGVYAGAPENLSTREAFPKLHALEQRYGSLILGQILGARERKRSGSVSKQNAPKFSFDQGLETLTTALGQQLKEQIRTCQAINKVVQQNNAWSLDQAGEYSAVLLALPAFRLVELQLTCDSNPVSLSELADIQYSPVASVVLGFRREDVEHPLDGFGALNPQVEQLNSLGTIFSSSLFPGRAPLGQVLLTSYVGGLRAPHLVTKTPDELCDLVMEDLNRVLGVSGEPTYRHVFVHRRAIPQYDVGFGRFKTFMNELEQNVSGLFFAGHCRDGVSLVDSIVSGHNAADRIAGHLHQTCQNE
ncbi:MAG: protoporphyrinogen oxidase [Verrucomicrobiota bacterium]|nr:protoporphyrinogen oxidase [Verrucomicrobiota bacterium]MDP7049317.1 protoporphyrinogen oxidase [Verrucomicrobiota bacterium]